MRQWIEILGEIERPLLSYQTPAQLLDTNLCKLLVTGHGRVR